MQERIPLLLVIIGVTGDLAKRKLLPAIEAIARAGALPEHSVILGTTRRTDVTLDDVGTRDLPFVREHLELFQMDTDDTLAYTRLATRLTELDQAGVAQRLFYMSVPPSAVLGIVEHMGTSGLARVPQTKLLLEKPFGTDLASATELVKQVEEHFTASQVYRIDHYLAKQTVQNLLVFREHNSLFRRTWNKDFIERIEIRASETLGVKDRAHFYEQTGALRDVVQSHLLQLAALTLMKLGGNTKEASVSERRLAALKTLGLAAAALGRRGQYVGYRDEVQHPDSTIETYVELTLTSSDPAFAGIPIRLITGKMLHEKTTEVRVYYKKEQDQEANELVLRLQPNEGITLQMWSGRPGYEGEIEKKTLDFTYADYYAALPDAYEKVLVDVMRSDHDLFVSSEEVLESWRILAPLQESWKKSSDDLFFYTPGDPSL